MEIDRPQEVTDMTKLTKKQKKSLIEQLKNFVDQETNIIIVAAAVFVLVVTPFVAKQLPSTTLQGAKVSLSPSPTTTVTPHHNY